MARFFWDTNHYIYLFEGSPAFQSTTIALRQRILRQHDDLLTSALTLGEIQVKALNEGQPGIALDLKRRVVESSQIVSFDAAAGDAFAHIRTTTSVKGADAVHLACAMAAGTDFFITNDMDLHKLQFPGIGRITSAQLVPGP